MLGMQKLLSANVVSGGLKEISSYLYDHLEDATIRHYTNIKGPQDSLPRYQYGPARCHATVENLDAVGGQAHDGGSLYSMSNFKNIDRSPVTMVPTLNVAPKMLSFHMAILRNAPMSCPSIDSLYVSFEFTKSPCRRVNFNGQIFFFFEQFIQASYTICSSSRQEFNIITKLYWITRSYIVTVK